MNNILNQFISLNEIAILNTIATSQGGTRGAWIAKEVGTSRQVVFYSLKRLSGEGWIRAESRHFYYPTKKGLQLLTDLKNAILKK